MARSSPGDTGPAFGSGDRVRRGRHHGGYAETGLRWAKVRCSSLAARGFEK
jgi:hypothetical protein